MQQGRPSETAVMMAVLRAHHYLTNDEPRLLDDCLAILLAGLTSTAQVLEYRERVLQGLAVFGDRAKAEVSVHALTMGTCCRSRLVEDELRTALPRGIEQLVLLGAGLDSLAYRRPDLTGNIAVFEVDYPATQVWKRDRLSTGGIAIPNNLRFVSLDLERQTLSEVLLAGGVRAVPTFFSWLGVQPYLTHEAVMATLDTVARFPSGSQLTLDVLTNDHEADRAMSEGGRSLLASVGEPFISAYQPDEFAAHLQQRGFSHTEMFRTCDWLERNAARFHGRFSAALGPGLLVTAQVS